MQIGFVVNARKAGDNLWLFHTDGSYPHANHIQSIIFLQI